MSAIMIRDLPNSRELDRQAMSTVRGGALLEKLSGPFANVNIGVNQNIIALQDIDVNVLNNSVIGAGFDFRLQLDPTLIAKNVAVF